MTFEQYYKTKPLNEGLKDKLLSLGVAASLFGTNPDALADDSRVIPPVVKTVNRNHDIEATKRLIINHQPKFNFNTNIVELLKNFENSKTWSPGGYNKQVGKWFEYMDQGVPAIGYGHNMSQQEINNKVYKNGIDDIQATKLLKQDITQKEQNAKQFIIKYDSFPTPVKNAILVAIYRGDLTSKHKTTKLINQGNFIDAAIEFLDNKDFRESGLKGGVGKRMLTISKILYEYGISQQVTEEIDTPNNGFLSRTIGGPNLVNFSPNFKSAPGIYWQSDQIHTPTIQATRIKAIRALKKRKNNG